MGVLNLSGTGSIFDNIIMDHSRFGTTDINRERFTIPKSRNYYMQFKFSNSSIDAEIDIRNWELYYMAKSPTDL